jgi:hypothetical protein
MMKQRSYLIASIFFLVSPVFHGREAVGIPCKKSNAIKIVEPIQWRHIALPSGRVSSFGGPNDDAEYWKRASLTGGLCGELDPATYYCAFRFSSAMDRQALREGWIAFTHPTTNRTLEAKIVDWGPGILSRSYDLSPALMKDLGLRTDQSVTAILYLEL